MYTPCRSSPPRSPRRPANGGGGGRSPPQSPYVPTPVYPWTDGVANNTNTGAMDYFVTNALSASSDNIDVRRTSLLADTISRKSVNFNSRIQERLTASLNGLKELDTLREKHRRLIHEVKKQIQFPSTEDTVNGKYEFGDQQQQVRSPSPAPSAAEMSSNISHRSSLSMDSGFLSLASDAVPFSHQHTLSADSGSVFSLPPSRKNSATTTTYFPVAVDASDDEGCYVDFTQNHNHCSTLTSSTSQPCMPENLSIPKAFFGYRRRGILCNRPKSLYSYPEENTVLVEMDADEPSTLNRPRINRACSIQCGNLTERRKPPIKDTVYRASKIYLTPSCSSVAEASSSNNAAYVHPSLRYAPRRSRPTSMALSNFSQYNPSGFEQEWKKCGGDGGRAQPPRSVDNGQHSNSFTWEQVKRLLDPAFDARTLVRHHSTVNVNSGNRSSELMANKLESTSKASSVATVTRFNGDGSTTPSVPPTRSTSSVNSSQEHIVVSRSVSSQSSDSNRSARKKEKSWRESDNL